MFGGRRCCRYQNVGWQLAAATFVKEFRNDRWVGLHAAASNPTHQVVVPDSANSLKQGGREGPGRSTRVAEFVSASVACKELQRGGVELLRLFKLRPVIATVHFAQFRSRDQPGNLVGVIEEHVRSID
jgi:hypothetical protein